MGYIPGVSLLKQMFNRNKRLQRALRCYAIPPDSFQMPEEVIEKLNTRPLLKTIASLEKNYALKQILNSNSRAFINDLTKNRWGFQFHHSWYKSENNKNSKIQMTKTETRNPEEIKSLASKALEPTSIYALGVNLSSNLRAAQEVDFIVLDLDPPAEGEWYPLEGPILKLIVDYYMEEFPPNKFEELDSTLKNQNLSVPFIVKTPRGLHMMFRSPVVKYTSCRNRLERDKRLTGLNFIAEYITTGNINLLGGPYEILLCPNSFQNIPFLPEFLTPGCLIKKLKSTDAQPFVDLITKGQRNTTLFGFCRLNKDITLETLKRINRYFCDPPLEETEIVQIIESISRFRNSMDLIKTQGSKNTSITEAHNYIKQCLTEVGPSSAKGPMTDITTLNVIQTSLRMANQDDAKELIKLYLKTYHNEKGLYNLLADMIVSVSHFEIGLESTKMLRLYSQAGTITYKYYNADEGIWQTADRQHISSLIYHLLETFNLGDYLITSKIEEIHKMMDLKAAPGDLPRINGVQFNNGFFKFIERELLPTSPLNYAQSKIPIDIDQHAPMDSSVQSYWLQIGGKSSA
jgi:hypothetical protein